MNGQHGLERFESHLGQRLLAEDAGVVDHHIDLSEFAQRGLDKSSHALRCRHRVCIGDRNPARRRIAATA
jgi:hypothetical protein